jgi:hypothetical protein
MTFPVGRVLFNPIDNPIFLEVNVLGTIGNKLHKTTSHYI